MKLKIAKLLLFFLATGLFVSSKEKAGKNCIAKCLQYSKAMQNTKEENTQGQKAGCPIVLAPANFIFYL
jgi:hypothetical protein